MAKWRPGGRPALPPAFKVAGSIDPYDPRDEGNGNGMATDNDREERALASACGCSVQDLRSAGMAALYYMRSALKGGNINQGYAICDADPLTIKVARGECPTSRIQCRQPTTLRATAIAAATGTASWNVRPVGEAFLRELLLLEEQTTAPAVGETWVTAIESAGIPGLTGTVTQTAGTGAAANGFRAAMFARSFQNYVVPSGIWFEPEQPLAVAVLNRGGLIDVLNIGLTYDLVRRSG